MPHVPLLGPNGEIVKTLHYEEEDDRLFVSTHQDVEAIIEENKARQNNDHDGYTQNRAMRQIAEIPTTVIYGWLIADGLPPNLYQAIPDKRERSAWLKKKLRDPDNRFFKTVSRI